MRQDLKTDVLVCALGTTIIKAKKSRNHTELLFKSLGMSVFVELLLNDEGLLKLLFIELCF